MYHCCLLKGVKGVFLTGIGWTPKTGIEGGGLPTSVFSGYGLPNVRLAIASPLFLALVSSATASCLFISFAITEAFCVLPASWAEVRAEYKSFKVFINF